MSLLKKLLIGLLLLVVAAVGSTFFMSDDFRVTKTQFVNAPPEAIYNQIVTPKNWENWSYWNTLDDKMQLSYNDIPTGVGASYSWKSKKREVGNGTLTIKMANPNEYIQAGLTFDEGDGWCEYIIYPNGKGSDVVSAMNTETKGVFMKLMSRTMMKRGMQKAFKISMENMEKYLTAHPFTPTVSPVSDSAKI
jgi:uncharacterized protein YndB with AHSA1/START domain